MLARCNVHSFVRRGKREREGVASPWPRVSSNRFLSSCPDQGLRAWSALSAGLGIGMFGIPGAPFGAAMISSVARFGLPAVDVPFVPFVPFTRVRAGVFRRSNCPSVVAREGEAVVVDTVEVRVSYDHRVCGGAQLAGLLEDFLQACYGSSASGPRPSLDQPVTGDRPTG